MEEEANISSLVLFSRYNPDVDYRTTLIYTYLIYGVVCQIIAISGIVTNIINIICFVKQGFKESVNITLLGLTVSDLCCLISLIFVNIFMILAVNAAEMPFDVMGVYYIAVGMPHLTFNRVSTWITAIITLERCLCILTPLKIKIILTPERMFALIVCVYMILIFSGAPVYVVNRLDMVFSPWRNKTVLGLVSLPDGRNVEKISLTINGFFMPCAAFGVIIVCTAILVVSLGRRAKWRQMNAVTSQSDVNNRNIKVAKMVVMISTLFISCFVPMAVIMFAVALVPSFNIDGVYVNLGMIIAGIAIFTECINSSSNIFIYYHMSVKYRETFNSIFSKANKNQGF